MSTTPKNAVLLDVDTGGGQPGTGSVVIKATQVTGFLNMVSGDDTKTFNITIYDIDSNGNPSGKIEIQKNAVFAWNGGSGSTFARTALNVVDGSSGTSTLVNFNSGNHRISVTSVTSVDVNNLLTLVTLIPASIPTAGQALVGNAGGTAYGAVSISADATLASTGAITLATVNSNIGTFNNATITVDAKGRVTAVTNGITINQTSHGFSVGNLVRLSGTTYVTAKADSVTNAEVVGIVSTVIDANNFVIAESGSYITGLSGLTAGTVYFLSASSAGLLTSTEPISTGQVSKPVLVADSTISGYFINWRGMLVNGGTFNLPSDVGYITRCVLGYTDITHVYLSPGSAAVNGTVLIWNSNLTFAGTSGSGVLTSAGIVYVYLYDSGSAVAAIECSTTAPTLDSVNDCYKKTGDITRRYVGYFLCADDSGTKVIYPFYQTFSAGGGRSCEYLYMEDGNFVSASAFPQLLLSSGSTTTSWTSQDLAALVPAYATHWLAKVGLIFTSDGDEGVVGLSTRDLTSSIAGSNAPYTARAGAPAAGSRTFPGRFWMPIEVATDPVTFWRVTNAVGTISCDLVCHGVRIYR